MPDHSRLTSKQEKLCIELSPPFNRESQRPVVEQGLNDVVTRFAFLIATRLRRLGVCLAVQSHNSCVDFRSPSFRIILQISQFIAVLRFRLSLLRRMSSEIRVVRSFVFSICRRSITSRATDLYPAVPSKHGRGLDRHSQNSSGCCDTLVPRLGVPHILHSSEKLITVWLVRNLIYESHNGWGGGTPCLRIHSPSCL
jgi:hypothetical protein